MPTYEVEINGETFEIEAPDDQSVKLAVRQLQSGAPQSAASTSGFEGGSAGAAALGAADTFSFGFGDELGAGLGATSEWLASKMGGPEPRSYDQLLGAMRTQDKAASEANPWSYGAGQVAGGVAGGLGLGAVGALPRMAQGASLASRAAVGAGEGFGLGALYGLGTGEGEDTASSALVNGAVGAAGGAAVPLIAQGVASGYRGIMDRMARNDVARSAGVSPEVASHLTQVLDADSTLGPQGRANMQRAGGEAMLADAGPNAQGVLDAAIQRPGPGSALARGRVNDRVGRDSQAVARALDQSLGVPEGVNAAQKSVRDGARQAVSDAYDGPNGAYAQPIDYASEQGQRLEGIINRIPPRIANKAIQQANERLTYSQTPNQQILADIAEDGTISYREMPNVRQADAIKRALNDIVNDGTDPQTRKMSSEAQFASEMATDLRDALRDAVPAYGDALRTAADPLSRQSAIQLGSKILSRSMTRDQVQEATRRFTGPEQDALAQGVRSNIDDIMANVTRTVRDGGTEAKEAYKAIRDLSSRANREKLEIALGPERVSSLFDELDRAGQSFSLQGRMADGSQTFARNQTNDMVKQTFAPGAVGTLARGKPLNAAQRIAQLLTGQTDEAVQGRENAMFSEIADYLTRPADQAIPAFQAMTDYGTQTATNQASSAAIARLLSETGRPLVYPSAALSTR